MYVKIQPKEYPGKDIITSYGYALMKNVFDDLVFSCNLDGYSEGGSSCVVKVGGGRDTALEIVRREIMAVWENDNYPYQPDDLLKISFVESIRG